MKNIKVKNIVIVGTGTAGWLSALFLSREPKFRDNPNYNVTVIESPNIPTIGVGESTQPLVTSFMDSCDLTPNDWMPQSSATYKLGVMFEGWGKHKFMVDSEDAKFHFIEGALNTQDIAKSLGMSSKDYMNWHPSFRLSINNISPRIGKERFNYSPGNFNEPDNAAQWDNVLLQKHLKDICITRGVKLITDNVVDVGLDEQDYVTHVLTENHGNINGDFYIDATGFHAVLASKVNNPWLSVENFLPNNNAVVVRKKYKNPQQECHPYTNAKTMNAGWRWSIPTHHDMSYGYVYSDKYIDKDDAEKELRESINEWKEPALHVPFNAGLRQQICNKNVLSVGFTAGFVEPLEATSLAFTCVVIGDFDKALAQPSSKGITGVWNDQLEHFVNTRFHHVFREIAGFIYMHYHGSTRRDTEYWKAVGKIGVPEYLQELYRLVQQQPLTNRDLTRLMAQGIPTFEGYSAPTSMFAGGHWYQLLSSYGWYDDWVPAGISDVAIQYGKMVMDFQTKLADEVIKSFPNHYDYLTEWYESC